MKENKKKQYERPVVIAKGKADASTTACGKYSACGELVRGR